MPPLAGVGGLAVRLSAAGRARRAGELVLLAMVCVAATLLCLYRVGPHWMNADTVLYTVMSLQNPTLFYWGQDRLLNVVSFVTQPIRDPDANLLATVLIHGVGFIGLLALLGNVAARAILGSTARLDAWLCFAALLFVFLAIYNAFAIHVFVVEGQPYGLSCLLMGAALLRLIRPPFPGVAMLALAVGAVVVAAGLNPSLLLLCAMVCLLAAIMWPARRGAAALAAALSMGCCAAWLIVGTSGSTGGYAVVAETGAGLNLLGALLNLGVAFQQSITIALSWATLALFAILYRTGRGDALRLWGKLLAGLALAWLLVVAQNAWVVQHGWHFRYFYPVLLVFALLLALPWAVLLARLPARAKPWAATALLAASMAMVWSTPRPFDEFNILLRARPAVTAAHAAGARFVAGDYWHVWPAVFLLLRDGDAHGLEANRGIGGQALARASLAGADPAGPPPRGICVSMDLPACLSLADRFTASRWQAGAGDCGPACAPIALAPGGR